MGPVATVVLGRDPTDADRATVAHLVRSLGEVGPGGADGPDVWIRDTKVIGGTYQGDGRPFWLEWQTADHSHDDWPAWRARFEERFGLTPMANLLVTAGTNRAPDHRVLGEAVLCLARALEGVIDFEGALLPLASPGRVERVSWPEVSASAQVLFDSIPGKILEIEYQVDEQRTWAWHVGDCEFLQGWLHHPDFHMIK